MNSLENWTVGGNDWENKFIEKIHSSDFSSDPSHDLAHFQRVVRSAKSYALKEGARLEVVIPAAWLHDLVNLPKNHPDRSKASHQSAQAAVQYLEEVGYPSEWHEGIFHAIHTHSFSAQVTPETLEAKVVQDADRMDALGAIGMARCFMVGGALKRTLYSPNDPFCEHRPCDDLAFTLDHFYAKLFTVGKTLHTGAAREEAQRRVEFMKQFLVQLESEIGGQ